MTRAAGANPCGGPLTVAPRPPSAFFESLQHADDKLAELEQLRADNRELRWTVASLGCIVQRAEHDRDQARDERDELQTALSTINGRLDVALSERDTARAEASR